MNDDVQEKKATSRTALAFGITALASLGLAITYARGGQEQIEGTLLAVALGGLGFGFVQVAKHLLPQGPYVEGREALPSSGEDQAAFAADFERGEGWLSRRGFLLKMLGLAAGAIGIAALFPIRSLGKAPGRALFQTAWKPGARAVTEDGKPVRAASLLDNSVLTVFPEGHTDEADSQDWPSISAMTMRYGETRGGLPASVVLPWHLQFPGQARRIAGQTGGRIGRPPPAQSQGLVEWRSASGHGPAARRRNRTDRATGSTTISSVPTRRAGSTSSPMRR